MPTSRIPGFYKLPIEKRLKIVKEFASLTDEDMKILKSCALDISLADKMIENVVSTFELPIGIAVNFLINGEDYMVPMAIEEPSVVAAASNMAKVTRENGGIRANASDPIMIGQIHLSDLDDLEKAKIVVEEKAEEIVKKANEIEPSLLKYGGGAKSVEVRITEHEDGERFLVVHLLVDCKDAMGANVVNTMVEGIAPFLERICKGKAYLKIISNLAVYRTAEAEVVIKPETIGGKEVVDGIVKASKMAEADPFRACTHNKGIMNGITAVALATGNDTRAIEAGCHAFACKDGRYKPLAIWRKDKNGNLVGKIKVPLAVATVGGAIRSHPKAKISLKILRVKSSKELAMVMASVGLVQNLAAIKAIVTEGINRGHMELHARNIALSLGIDVKKIDEVVDVAVFEARKKGKRINTDLVKEVAKKMGVLNG